MEGYVSEVLSRPIFIYLNSALGSDVPLFGKPLHSIFRDNVVEEFKNLSTRIIANDEAIADRLIKDINGFYKKQESYRNKTMHGLYDPDPAQIREVRAEAQQLLDAVERLVLPEAESFQFSVEVAGEFPF